MSKPLHVAVLMGGWAPEREISLLSGTACAAALREKNYQVSEVIVDHNIAARLAELQPDICFNALHGIGGEDGVIQGVLETLQIPYTHSGVAASALAMDKIRSKKLFAAAGIPVAADVVIEVGSFDDHPLPPPYVIKPINQGSSVGIYIVEEGQNHLPVIEDAYFAGGIMAEDYITGRELTCAVLGDEVLDVMEIIVPDGWYDYHNKYTKGRSQHIFPTDLPAALIEEVRDYSWRAHQILGCRGVSRADFRYDENGKGLVILEVNSQPGLTALSLVPDIAAHRDIKFADLVECILKDAACQK